MKLLLLLLLLTAAAHVGHAKILFWMPFVFKSATLNYGPLAEELARRGHEVIVVTSYLRSNTPANLQQIQSHNESVLRLVDYNSQLYLNGLEPDFFDFYGSMCQSIDKTLEIKDIKALFDKTASNSLDMVIVYADYTCSEVGYYISEVHEVPLVLFSTFQGAWPHIDQVMGQPHHPGIQPMLCSTRGYQFGAMSFVERYINSFETFMLGLVRSYYMFPQMEAILDKHFGSGGQTKRKSLEEIERDVSLTFSFGHPILTDGWRPTVPNFVQLGMMNCVPAQSLPPDNDKIGRFLNENAEIIFVSFGSLLQASKMPESMRTTLIEAFEKLKPMKILWKWETEEMPNKPSNVLLSKWVPQQDVLGHPHVKVFITHGGQSSFQESLCHKKPTVVIPIFGDQLGNALETERLGVGKLIRLTDLTSDKLEETVQEVLESGQYKKRAEEVGELLLDQIDKPLQRAIWWIEHVLRHPKLYPGISPIHGMTWYQYFLLDVIGFTLLILATMTIISCSICKSCFSKSKHPKQD